MANTLTIKRSAVPSKVPLVGDLQLGELAVNTYDGKLFLKKDNGTASIVEIGAGGGGGATVTQSLSTSPPSSPAAGNLWWQTDTGSLKIYYTDVDTSQWVDASPGAAGPAGSAATISVGTVTELLPVDTPTVTNSGTSSAAVLNFGLPRAPSVGVGTISVLNPNQNPSITTSGVDGDKNFNFFLPRAAAVSVGTVTTGIAGSAATVTNVGTNGDVVLDFKIPAGDTGPAGSPGPKTVSVYYPTSNEIVTVLYTSTALTLSAITAIRGPTATGSCNFTVYHTSTYGTGYTTVLSGGSVTGITTYTSFSTASIPANKMLIIVLSGISGVLPEVTFTCEFA